MSVYGKQGLRELAEQNLAKAHYLAANCRLLFDAPFFHEFVFGPMGNLRSNYGELLTKKIIGGLPLGRFIRS